MRKYISLVEGIGRDGNFDDTDVYLTYFKAEDLPKFATWSLTKLSDPFDAYRRARMIIKLPPINPAVEGLVSGINDLRASHKVVQFIMRELGHTMTYEKMLTEIGVPVYTGPKQVVRITPEQAAEFEAYPFVKGDQVPLTDDWEAIAYKNTDPSHGPGTFQKSDKEMVVSRKMKVRRFPTSGEYHGIFGNSGW